MLLDHGKGEGEGEKKIKHGLAPIWGGEIRQRPSGWGAGECDQQVGKKDKKGEFTGKNGGGGGGAGLYQKMKQRKFQRWVGRENK